MRATADDADDPGGALGATYRIQFTKGIRLRRDGRASVEGANGRPLEITDSMVRAGLRILYRSGSLEYEAPGADELLMRELLRMALRMPAEAISCRNPSDCQPESQTSSREPSVGKD